MWTRAMVERVRRAERHGWRVEEMGAKGVYLSRCGRDRRVYVAYLAA